jgi:EAL domain-containing protein (putative c-di-GMP-specific phosphodiesterase class I)
MRLLENSRTAARELCLEVTETALAADAAIAARALSDLTARGVAVSIDDFGAGYTCLSQLRSLPVAEIKIDRVFVSGIDSCEEDRSIVRSIIDLGHALSCKVTAEGVETPETATWLQAASCDSAQGYHYAHPVPWPDLLERFGDRAHLTALEPATT